MSNELSIQEIQSCIKTIPEHHPFMLAQDLANIYDTPVKHINQAVKRNPKRFPLDFCFQLTRSEVEKLRSQSVTKIYAGTRKLPYGFTREGANMLSAVLQSDVAIERSIQIMRAFSALESQNSGSSNSLTTLMGEILTKLEKSLAESQRMSQDFSKMNERINVIENQIEALMKVRGGFDEKHWLFGKFVEVIAEGIDQNREEISKLKKQFEKTPQRQIEAPTKKVRKLSSKSKSR